MIDVERCTELRDWLRDHREQVQMDIWVGGHAEIPSVNNCGTRACAAGWAVLLAGDRVRTGDFTRVASATDASGALYTIPQRAQELLGLTDHQAGYLFHLPSGEDVVAVLSWWIAEEVYRQTQEIRELVALDFAYARETVNA